MTSVVLLRALAGICALSLTSALIRSYPMIRGVRFEHVTNKFGHHFVFYDHAISSTDTYTAENKLSSRLKQFASFQNLASIGPKVSGTNAVQCNVTNLKLEEIKLHRMEGATTFFESPRNDFYPASNGLFYVKSDFLKSEIARESCCLNNDIQRLVAPKTTDDQKILSRFLTENEIRGAFVRATYFPKEKSPLWEDGTQVAEKSNMIYPTRNECGSTQTIEGDDKNFDSYYSQFSFINRSTVRISQSGNFNVHLLICHATCICVHNIFPGDWEDLLPNKKLGPKDDPSLLQTLQSDLP